MIEKTRKLLHRALELGENERAGLAAALLGSLDPSPEAGVEEAWSAEIERRVRSIDAADVELIPWDEVRERLHARLRGASPGCGPTTSGAP